MARSSVPLPLESIPKDLESLPHTTKLTPTNATIDSGIPGSPLSILSFLYFSYLSSIKDCIDKPPITRSYTDLNI